LVVLAGHPNVFSSQDKEIKSLIKIEKPYFINIVKIFCYVLLFQKLKKFFFFEDITGGVRAPPEWIFH